MKNIRRAFTLVELLIAMFIFAMLAVLLVPNVSNTAERELFATQLKKVRNDLQQAMLLMTTQNQGTLEGFCAGGTPNACFIGAIKSRLEVNVAYGTVMTDCTAAEIALNDGTCNINNQKIQYNQAGDAQDFSGGCEGAEDANGSLTNPAKSRSKQTCLFLNKQPLRLDNNNFAGNGKNTLSPGTGQIFSALNLANGATITVNFDSNCRNNRDLTADNAPANTKICGYMAVDVNAGKGPDTLGKDIYFFWITAREGIIPFGEIDTNGCANNNNGLGCAYRVLREGRITYY